MNSLRFLVFGMSAMAALSLMMMAALAADDVTIAAGHHPGFGRIAFRWPSPVEFTLDRDGSDVLVRFARPISGSFDRVKSELDDYVASAQVESDGKTVRLALKKPFELRSFKDGTATVVLDLIGKPAGPSASPAATAAAQEKGQPEKQRAAASEPASHKTPAPRVLVRKGEHPGYDRLVFDWPKEVGYRVSQEGNRGTISFDGPARLEFLGLSRHPLRYAADLKSEQTPSGTVVSLRLADSAQLRGFRDGPRVALDIVAGAKGARAEASPARSASAKPGKDRKTQEPVFVTVGPGAKGGPTSLVKSGTVASNGASAAASGAQAATDGLPVGYTSSDKGTVLRFPWTDKVLLAAFRQNDSLWLVFDRQAKLDLSQIPITGDGRNFDQIDRVADPQATILRLHVYQGVVAHPHKDGTAWVVDLDKGADRPTVPLNMSAEPNSPIGPRVTFALDHPGAPFQFTDPQTGNKLVIVPVSQPGLGVFGERAYVEFRLLASAQGIAVEPLVSGVYVTARLDDVDIRDEKGLILSALPDTLTESNVFGNAATTPALFDVPAWCGDLSKPPLERKQVLEEAMSQAKTPAQRDKARLDLAHFYFAEDMAPEAQGLINLIARDNPALLDTPQGRAFRGAVAVLRHDHDTAAKFLGDKSLDLMPEAALWRGIDAAQQGDYGTAENGLIFGGGLIAHYAPSVQLDLEFLAADALLANGDKERVRALLDGLKKRDLTTAEKGRLSYLRGRLIELEAHREGALALYEEAEKSGDPLSAERAALARIAAQTKFGTLSRKDAIKQLDALRYDWRGDAVELDLLDRLGRLYLANGNYRNALITLRRAVTYFPDSPRAKVLAGLMSDIFADLFVKGGIEKVPPVEAVAIYDDFKELAPTGAAADKAALHLADRLVAADLLDRGAALLDDLVKNRLSGEDKLRAATRLAKVRLLNGQPQQALDALAIGGGDLPDDLAAEQRYIQAQALADLNKPADAIAALGDDVSPKADAIRSEILWHTKNWAAASQLYDRMTKGLPQDKTPLTQAQSDTALRWAVALTMLGDQAGFDSLRTRFGAAVPKGADRDAFMVLTSATSAPGEGFRKLAKTVADLDQLKSFMADYKKEFARRAAAAPVATD